MKARKLKAVSHLILTADRADGADENDNARLMLIFGATGGSSRFASPLEEAGRQERGKQARLDSNQDTQDQNLMCYRYTTGLSD